MAKITTARRSAQTRQFSKFMAQVMEPVTQKPTLREAIATIGEALQPLGQLERDVIAVGLALLAKNPEQSGRLAMSISVLAGHEAAR